jgi:thiazole synthase ThiGH ThiG subunit
MARAFKLAVEAGREAREIGLSEKRWSASATSPVSDFFRPAKHVE